MLIDGRFVAVFPRLVRALEGDVTAAAVLQAVHYRANTGDGWLELPLAEIADEIGISRDQTQRACARLRQAGLLLADGDRGRLLRWRIDHDAVGRLESAAPAPEPTRNRVTTDAESRHHRRDIALLTSNTEEEEELHKGPAAVAALEHAAAVVTITEGQRVNRLAKVYVDRVPLSSFPAVAGVVRKAVRAGMWPDADIAAALERLADEGRAVTADTLRYELHGFAGPRSNRERAIRDGVQLARDLAEIDPWGPRELAP